VYIHAPLSFNNIGAVVALRASCIVFAVAAAAILPATGCKDKTKDMAAKDSATTEKPLVDSAPRTAPTPPPAAPVSTAQPTTPASVIDSLYKIHNNGLGPILDGKGREARLRFFAPSLVALFAKELEGAPSDEVGNLDFDPFYNAQDVEIHDFKIGEPRIKGDTATVLVTFRNFDRKENLDYTLVDTPDGWRISNIDYGDNQNLVAILSQP
jgi:hypothetical protein